MVIFEKWVFNIYPYPYPVEKVNDGLLLLFGLKKLSILYAYIYSDWNF
jgi:hypothetical protein